MDTFKLGPNGGLVYCMEFLEKNLDWLLEKLQNIKKKYLLIDCPGQVELYTHNTSVRNIIQKLEKFGTRLCSVHLGMISHKNHLKITIFGHKSKIPSKNMIFFMKKSWFIFEIKFLILK